MFARAVFTNQLANSLKAEQSVLWSQYMPASAPRSPPLWVYLHLGKVTTEWSFTSQPPRSWGKNQDADWRKRQSAKWHIKPCEPQF